MRPGVILPCELCGKSIVVKNRRAGPLLCVTCARRECEKRLRALRKPPAVQKPAMPAHEVERLARAAGMSYGAYVGRMGGVV